MSAKRYFKRGNVYLEQKQYREAINEYEKIVKADPKHAEAWALMGYAYNMIGEYDRGIACSRQALKINPELTSAFSFIGQAYAHLGEYNKVIDAYQQIINIDPQNADGWYGLGSTYFRIGEYKWAIDCFEKALEINPNDDYAKQRLEEALQRYPQYYEEKKATERVVGNVCPNCGTLSPENARFYKRCGTNLQKAPVSLELETTTETSPPTEEISIKRGYETAGQYVKVGIKVANNASTTITDVTVKLDAPNALEKVNPRSGMIELGVIRPKGSQSANFQLQPTRCVDDVIHAVVIYRDTTGKSILKDMKPLRIRSICPMLTDKGVDKEQILMSLRKGEIHKSTSSFKFRGDLKAAFIVAEARVRGLIQLDRDERFIGDNYIASACYIGRTKYGKVDFATEITVCGKGGKENEGLLTITVYSEDDAILSGFFYEVLDDVRKSVEIFEERVKVVEETCVECGAKLEKDKADAEGYLRCDLCETLLRLPSWERRKSE